MWKSLRDLFQLPAFQLFPGPAFITHHSSFILSLEGLLREFTRKGDAFHDVVMMALLRKEWPPAQKLDQPAAGILSLKRFLDAAPQPPREE
jgi:hypothetical protein